MTWRRRFRPIPLAVAALTAPGVHDSVHAQTPSPEWFLPRRDRPTHDGGVAFDPVRQRVVLFGGGETWERKDAEWRRRLPRTSPTAVTEGAMTFDWTRQRVVWFGGRDAARAPSAELWEWDGNDWSLQTPATTAPSARVGSALGYDFISQSVLMFGGLDATGAMLADTWSWDGRDWSRRTPMNSPPARMSHALTHDIARQQVVLFGGHNSPRGGGTSFTDTWLWNGGDWTRSLATPHPTSTGYAPSLTYDIPRMRAVLQDGGQTWEWDGNAWHVRNPTHAPGGGELAFDVARQRTVLFGGGETWEWDGVDWVAFSSPAGRTPSARMHLAMVDDGASGTVLLFGGRGRTFTGASITADTWLWNGSQWTLRVPSTSPPSRFGHALAYDRARRRVVLFSGRGGNGIPRGDTWEWDGSRWFAMSPARSPSARSGHAMVYDQARQRVLLFGGAASRSSSDTWEWDGSNWLQLAPASHPSNRQDHAMAYDSARQRTVLFGGYDAETWEWDGIDWMLRTPAVAPAARGQHVMAYDEAQQRVVLFGGSSVGSSPALLDDTWEWDGQAWQRQRPATPPSARAKAGMVFDSTQQRIVLFGGGDSRARTVVNDTLLYGPFVAASSRAFGTGCRGTFGTPILACDEPVLGRAGFSLDVIAALPHAACAIGVGSTSNPHLLPNGCVLHLDFGTSVFATIMTNSAGFASLPLRIPQDPRLRGLALFAQAFVTDPAGGSLGLAATHAMALVVGD